MLRNITGVQKCDITGVQTFLKKFQIMRLRKPKVYTEVSNETFEEMPNFKEVPNQILRSDLASKAQNQSSKSLRPKY